MIMRRRSPRRSPVVPTSSRLRGQLSSGMLLFAAAAAPLLIVLVLAGGPFSTLVVPEMLAPAELHPDPQAVVILADLPKTMMPMSVGLLVATAWLHRQRLTRDLGAGRPTLMVLAAMLAFVSIYAGLRFCYDLASQLRYIPLRLELLRSRLYWQGCALVLQVSVLCVAAVIHHRYAAPGRTTGE